MYTIKTMFWLLCGFIYCSKIISPYFSSMYKMSCDYMPKNGTKDILSPTGSADLIFHTWF